MESFFLALGCLWLTAGLASIAFVTGPLVNALDRESHFIPSMKVWLVFYICAPPLFVKSIAQVFFECSFEFALGLTSKHNLLLTDVSDALEKR